MAKPPLTGNAHLLPFEKLSSLDFELLCLWLVQREGYERVEHVGRSGSDGGRDVVAWKGDRRFAFQCKQVVSFEAADARKEIAKLRGLPVEEQPHELVFVVSRAVSAHVRSAARTEWGDEASCHFWGDSELDERVNRHPELLKRFFQLSPAEKPTPFRHNLPFTSLGPLFQGREEMLQRLHATLAQTPAGKATAIAAKAVHGLGGVGKTRLAIEYGWAYAAEYTAVLFVDASTPADLSRNLAALCAPAVLDLPEQAASDEEIQVTAALRWLGEHPGWLLILDNVDSEDAAEAVDALVSRLHGGHVLLTGRIARWVAEVEAIELDVLEETAAVDFLLARTAKRRKTPDDATQGHALARELGCLPLALEQAGAAIAERRLTFAGYLQEWHARRDQVLAWFDPRVSHYPVSFAVTWQTSVDRLTVPARHLLDRLAWLGPEPIPESLLEVPVPDLPAEEAIVSAFDALLELATYSLVTRASEAPTFTVHRLVQDVTRRSLRNDAGRKALTEALGWIDDAFVGDPGDVRTWPVLDPLALHARAVTTFADEAGISEEPTARLMNELGQLLKAKALLVEAEPLMRRALAIDEASFGPDNPNVATALNNLAQLFQATNRLGEAEPLMRRALAIDEASFGPHHPKVAIVLNNLALLLQATNRLEEAEPLMERVMTILEKSLGENHPNVATALNSLALLLQATNRLGEAEPLMARVAIIFEKNLGEDHPNLAVALNNLARLLQATNRLGEAEPLMRRAGKILQGFQRGTGYEHPRWQLFSANYRQMLQEMGRSDDEIEAALAALGMLPAIGGPPGSAEV
jgi:tetratricopeptide (TPR) repeat protein